MVISSKRNPVFSDPAALKQRFQKAAAEHKDQQAVIDRLERMAEGFLSLDGTEHDLDETPGAVFVGNGQTIATVQARPFGGVLSMEMVDSSGPQAKEFKIEPDLLGVAYTVKEGGLETSVYDSGNGLLALMDQIKELLPEKAEN
ncbi:MAG: hypothetical protein WC314_25730 [Vulcanimicrobiota bacterium]